MNPIRTTNFLMANLGSEMVRFFNLKRSDDSEAARSSAQRALAMIETLKSHTDIGNGKQEVAILESIVKDALTDAPQYHINSEDLNTYFLPFAHRELAKQK